MQPVSPGDIIDPFRIGKVIPHLPEEGCHQYTEPERNDGTPVPSLRPFGERAISEPDIDRFQNKVERNPNEEEEDSRPDQHQGDHDPAEGEEEQSRSFIGADARSAPEALYKVKAGEEFRTAKHRRNDRCKAQGRPKCVFEGSEDLGANISPILGADVEQLEDPPDRRRDHKQPYVFTWTTSEQRCPRAPDDEPVEGETISQP